MIKIGKIKKVIFNSDDYYVLAIEVSKKVSFRVSLHTEEELKPLKTVEFKFIMDGSKDRYGTYYATSFEKLKKKTTFAKQLKKAPI